MSLHFPSHETMTTTSFPPVDDLISKLAEVDYHKHIRNFINVVIIVAATVAAVATVLVQRIAQWYQQGGKDDLRQAYEKVANVCSICYLWVRCEGYPGMMQFFQEVQQTYRAWQDLVTV
jgi:hypothetical protein